MIVAFKKLLLGFVFLLLAMPMATAVITDYSAYYPFEYTSDWSYLSGPGGEDGIVVANDSNAYNYGRNGSMDFLDDSDNYVVDISTTIDFPPGQDFTMAVWVYSHLYDNDWHMIVGSQTVTDYWGVHENADRWTIYDGSQECGALYSTSGLAVDEWQYWMVTRNSTDTYFWLNNVSVDLDYATAGCNGDFSFSRLGDWNGLTYDYDGLLDEVLFLNYSLNSTERAELYNSGAGKRVDETSFYNESNTLYYNDMDVLKDQSDNGNDLITVNQPQQDPEGVPGIIGDEEDGQGWNLTATHFNGIDDYLYNSTYSGDSNGQTLVFWVNFDDVVTEQDTVVSYSSNEFGCRMKDGNHPSTADGQLTCRFDATDGYVAAEGLEPKTWYHIAWATEDGNQRLYVNGILNGTDTDGGGTTSYTGILLGTYTTYTLDLAGKMQDVNIYEEILDASTVLSLYQSGAPTQLMRDVYDTNLEFTDSLTYNKGTVMKFDGTDDYATADSTNIRFPGTTDDFSLCVWQNMDNLGNNYMLDLRDADNVGYFMPFFDNDDRIGCYLNYKDTLSSDNIITNEGQWHNVCCVFDRSNSYGEANAKAYVYVDGVDVTNPSAQPDISGVTLVATSDLRIGGEYDGSPMFDGKMDDIRIYNYSLTPAQVNEVYTYSQLAPSTPPTFSISANNGVDGGAISNFTATLTNTTATLINTSNGTSIDYGNLTGLFNITINKTGFFNYTNLNYNVTENPLTASMYYAKFHANSHFDNATISNFSIFINGQTYTANGTQINYSEVDGLQNVTYSHPNYFNKTVELNITSSNYTFNETLTYYRARVNISAYTAPDNSSLIHNFTINVTYLNGTLISTQNTTTGSLWAELVWNISNNVTIDAVNSTNVTYQIKSVTLNGTEPQAYNFSLYSTNSFLLEFFDSQTLQLLNNTNVTFFMMGETAFNASTNNGTYYVDLLLPSEYTIVSTAPGYRQNQYIVTLTDRSHTPIDIYLVNETDSSLVLLTVQDKYGNDIQGADITVQKYVNNAWIDEQILRTDQNGQTEGAFIVTTAYYNFYIDYGGVTVEGNPNNDTNKKTIYAEDVANGINFYIDIIQDQLALTYHDSLDISTNLSWVNTSNTTGYFRWFWNADAQWYGCLEVFKSGSGDTICSCNSNVAYASTGTLTCLINQSSGTQTYTAQGIIQIPTNNQFIRVDTVFESMIKLIGQDTRIQWGVTGYLIGFFILLVSYFIFLNMPTVSLFFGTGMFVILTLLGVIFKDIDYMVLITLMVITYLVATIKSEGGLNA